MRVARVKLIEQLQQRVKDLLNAAASEHEEALRKERERAAKYEEETREAWAILVGNVQDRLNGQQPILEEDIPAQLRRMSGYGYRRADVRRKQPATAELTRLIALLEASPDETVSIPSLERAGFTLGRVLK